MAVSIFQTHDRRAVEAIYDALVEADCHPAVHTEERTWSEAGVTYDLTVFVPDEEEAAANAVLQEWRRRETDRVGQCSHVVGRQGVLAVLVTVGVMLLARSLVGPISWGWSVLVFLAVLIGVSVCYEHTRRRRVEQGGAGNACSRPRP